MYRDITSNPDATDLVIGVVVSRYHAEITDHLRDGAIEFFHAHGGTEENLIVVGVPGAFELTAACAALAGRGDVGAIVALGCVITGETTHDQYINHAVSQGLASIAVQTGVPVAFGVLTCSNFEQARARAGGDKGNKGAEAMAAALETARTIDAIADAGGEA